MSPAWIGSFVPVLLTAFAATYLVTPFVINAANRFSAVDYPDPRKVHIKPVPRWGGLGLVAGVLAGLLCAFLVSHPFHAAVRGPDRGEIWGIAGACLLMVLVGIRDDLRPVSARIKLAWQMIAAAWLVAFGVRISFVTLPLSHHLIYFPSWFSWGASIFWIVGITNALNLLDGLDGLLAGISTISSLALFGIAMQKGYVFPSFVLVAMCGSTLAFLRYNFNPARIFLGDTGSLFLGVLWASVSISGALKTPTTALLIPLLILGLPIADTSFAILRRFGKGRSIFEPDKEHLHHQLLNLGWSQRKTVVILYLMGGVLGFLAYFLNNWLK